MTELREGEMLVRTSVPNRAGVLRFLCRLLLRVVIAPFCILGAAGIKVRVGFPRTFLCYGSVDTTRRREFSRVRCGST